MLNVKKRMDIALKRYVFKTIKLKEYKKDYRLNPRLPMYLNYTLIGLLLSDGGLERYSATSNVRLSVIMSIYNSGYLLHLYNLFEPYIDTKLRILDIKNKSKTYTNKIYSTIRFKTISIPQFKYYFYIFYKYNNINNNWEKVVPVELKYNFNGISLAHLIMGYGNFLSERNIIRIYTNSFKKEDVILLSNIINENLRIKNKVVHDRNNQYIIIIEKENVNLIREITLPYMHPSMLYKLGIKINSISNNKFDYINIIKDI